MIVCQCRGVSDRHVRAAVAEGCTSVRAVAAATGAGTVCGGCAPTLRQLACGDCPSRFVALACDDLPQGLPQEAAQVPVVQPVPVLQ